jgi:hypothetical protein
LVTFGPPSISGRVTTRSNASRLRRRAGPFRVARGSFILQDGQATPRSHRPSCHGSDPVGLRVAVPRDRCSLRGLFRWDGRRERQRWRRFGRARRQRWSNEQRRGKRFGLGWRDGAGGARWWRRIRRQQWRQWRSRRW